MPSRLDRDAVEREISAVKKIYSDLCANAGNSGLKLELIVSIRVLESLLVEDDSAFPTASQWFAERFDRVLQSAQAKRRGKGQPLTSKIQEAFEAGRDAKKNGGNSENSHCRFFTAPELTGAWQAGHDGEELS